MTKEQYLAIREVIISQQYLHRGDSAGRHARSSEEYIQHYPESAFLALFRMHRTSFWQLVNLLTQAGRPGSGPKSSSKAHSPTNCRM